MLRVDGGQWLLDGDLPVAFLHGAARCLDVLGARRDRWRFPALPDPLHAPTFMGMRPPIDLWVDWGQATSG